MIEGPKYYKNFPSFVINEYGKETADKLTTDIRMFQWLMRQYPIKEIRNTAVFHYGNATFLVPKAQAKHINEEMLKRGQRLARRNGVEGPVELKWAKDTVWLA